ncbi:hypothetical protein GPECTOR_4g650 [Gonium pectorale]|uniref:Uncharacterized protein n=1 Tax=Gonium pectorale TaxID=33097 RepID=A0A150GXP7_GONPE|nr:hypothetical protein GPECTOR_4g650 [Gonium pectorale]|eukprot:KXZ54585.1 hypothetical protein GPECTOR_4g650 [Gonium pectorale]
MAPVHVLRGHHGEVQSACFLSEEYLYTGLHDTNAGVLQLSCLPVQGALVRPQPLHEIHAGTFNFCRCAVWPPPGGGGGAPAGGTAPAAPAERLRDMRIACAGSDPADVVVWRPGEAPSAMVTLRQSHIEPKHGMCMSLAFLPPLPPAAGAPSAPAFGGDGGGAAAAAEMGASDPRFVVTGYEDGVVALWDLRRPTGPLGSLRVHSEPVMCVAAHPRAPPTRANSGVGDGPPDGSAHTAAGSGAPAPGCEGSGVGVATAAASAGGAEGSGDEAAGAPRPPLPAYDLVSGSADNQLSCCLLRPGAPQPVALLQQLRLREAGTAHVAVRPDGRLFAAACWDGRARLYSLRKRQPLAVLKYHRDQVTTLAFSPERSVLATASRDTTVALWEVYPTTRG